MNALVVTAAIASLVVVAAAGVGAGFRRRAQPLLEAPADPLEDRRLSLLIALKDLEAARESGSLEESEHRRLRVETEGRMARLLRARARRTSTATLVPVGDGLAASDGRRAERRTVPRWAVVILLAAAVAAATVATVLRPSVETPGPTVATGEDPLAFFEDRVREHPDDLAARLDLAHRYLDAGRTGDALDQYLVALEMDPDDAEAHAHLGLILYLQGRPEDALQAVERALETDPRYPEALLFKGVVLLRGLDRPQQAIEALEAYLANAPFGTERENATDLIGEAKARIGGASVP
jgi:cytochrome c-type biogenesis protein CcmH/NrfG